jgi:hypothetical protein
MREVRELWDGDQLRCGYLEIFGDSGIHMYQLLSEAGALRSKDQFIAVDQDMSVVFRHRANPEICDKLTMVHGDAYVVASRVAHEGTVGFYNFDGTDMGTPAWWDRHSRLLCEIVSKTVSRWGACMVSFNKSMDRLPQGFSPSDFLKQQADLSCAALLGRWGVLPKNLIEGTSSVHCVDDRKWTGRAGAYQVYRSEGRVLRMATLRLYFRGREVIYL